MASISGIRKSWGRNNLLDLYLFPDSDDDSDNISITEGLTIGDHILIFSAMIGIILYLDRRRDINNTQVKLVDDKIDNLLSVGRQMTSGHAMALLEELEKVSFLPKHFTDFCSRSPLFHRWHELRESIKLLKTGKAFIGQKKFVLDHITEMLNEMHYVKDIAISNGGDILFCESIIEYNPFLLLKSSDEGALLVYLLKEADEPNKTLYYFNQANNDLIEIPFEHAHNIKTKEAGILTRSYDNGKSIADFYGMFADSYPGLTNLAKHIFDNTEPKTQEELWSKSTADNPIDYKNAILLDIIENGPKKVLLEVASKERAELESYLEYLIDRSGSGEKYENVLETIRNKAKNAGLPFEEVLATTVVQRFGINIRTIGSDLKGIMKYSIEVNEHNVYQDGAASIGDLLHPISETSKILETILRELILFYGYYVYHDENGPRSAKADKDWKQLINSIGKSSIGIRWSTLRSFLQSSQITSAMLDGILGNEKKRVNFIEELIKLFDGDRNLCSLRNYFSSHEQRKTCSDISISTSLPKWSETNKNEIFKVASLFFDKMISFIRCLKGPPQVFPFKLTFTAYSITDQGIHRCHYRTDMHTEEAARNKIIFTDDKIDFNEIYYCLPIQTRSNKLIWIKPLLVKSSFFQKQTGSSNE